MATPAPRSSDPKSPFYNPEYALELELQDDQKRLGDRRGVRQESEERILDPADLIAIIKSTINGLRPEGEDLNEAIAKRHRFRDVKFDWPTLSLVGAVSRKGMEALATNATNSALEQLRAVQTTGDWRVAAVAVSNAKRDKAVPQITNGRGGTDVRIEHIVAERLIVVAVRFVDLRNGEEVIYKKGRPTSDEAVPAYIKALLDDRFRPVGEDGDEASQKLAAENTELRERLDRLEALLTNGSRPVAAKDEDLGIPADIDIEPDLGGGDPGPDEDEGEGTDNEEASLDDELEAAMREAPAPAPAPERRGPGRPRRAR